MRIIAGQRRGHKIDGPRASTGTRPTRDLIREALFNILGDLVADRTVVDLFAGTGALGLEAPAEVPGKRSSSSDRFARSVETP
jgi:16S rRNA (guanine966-N2)-methyltransferase